MQRADYCWHPLGDLPFAHTLIRLYPTRGDAKVYQMLPYMVELALPSILQVYILILLLEH